MRTLPHIETLTSFHLNPAVRMGHVHLTVANLERQIGFYQEFIGLKLHWRIDSSAGLGVGGEDLLRMTESQTARRYQGTTGLYHFALLMPDRRELARVIGRLFTLGHPNYPTDHIQTKSTYLDDTEGNNIEIYTESPEDGTFSVVNNAFIARRADGTLSDGREAIDVEAFMRNLLPGDRFTEPMPSTARMGHFHLFVAGMDETMYFYADILGFDNRGIGRNARMGMVSVAGYHHHIGFNTWVGEGAPPPPPGALGMRYMTILMPDQAELERVSARLSEVRLASEIVEQGLLIRDPSQNGVLLSVAHADHRT
jgi:catechol 2,3-dioxygenase